MFDSATVLTDVVAGTTPRRKAVWRCAPSLAWTPLDADVVLLVIRSDDY